MTTFYLVINLSDFLDTLAQEAGRLTFKFQAFEEINKDVNGSQLSIREDLIVSKEWLMELLLCIALCYNHVSLLTMD